MSVVMILNCLRLLNVLCIISTLLTVGKSSMLQVFLLTEQCRMSFSPGEKYNNKFEGEILFKTSEKIANCLIHFVTQCTLYRGGL